MNQNLMRFLANSTERTAEGAEAVFVGKRLLDSVFLADLPSKRGVDGWSWDAQNEIHHVSGAVQYGEGSRSKTAVPTDEVSVASNRCPGAADDVAA